MIKVAALTSAAIGALILGTSAANAQARPQAGNAEGAGAQSDIIVTGTRAAIKSAIDDKRNADQIVDSVVAEDVNKLPDANVAESLQRVPGVQLDRNFGEGAQVSIRGLSNVRVELNGRSNLGISVGPTGSDPSGRSTGLEQQSSTLFSKLSVYKTPTADQIEGGLGGFISMTTPRPFDFKKPTFGYAAEYTNTTLARNPDGYSLAGFAAAKLGRMFGIAANIAYSDREIGSSQFIRGIWNTGTSTGLLRDYNGDGQYDFVPQVARAEFYNIRRKRFGAGGTVQFRPADNLTFYGDALYTSLETQRHIEYLAIQTTDTGAAAPTLSNGVTEGNYVVAGTLTNQRVRVGGVERNEPTTSIVAGGGVEWKPGRWTFKVDAGESIGDYTFRQDFLEVASNGLVVNYDYRTGDVPTLTLPTTFNPTLRSSFPNRTNSAANDTVVRTRETAVRMDNSYRVGGWLESVQFGGRYSRLTSSFTDYQAKLGFTNPNIATLPDAFFIPSNNPGYPGANGTYPTVFIVPNVYADGTGDSSLLLSNFRPTRPRPVNSYYIVEKTYAFYGRLNLKGEILGLGFSGNVGLRWARTNFSVDTTSALTVAGTSTVREVPRTDVNNYDEFLPSANIKFSVARDLVIRLAASRVMSRARLQDLAPRLSVNAPLGTATGGNAGLRPTTANQVDAAIEYYIPGGGIASATFFFKDIKDQVARTTVLEVIPGFESFGPLQRSIPINLGAATVTGVELNYQQAFTFLPGLLSGLGTQLNATLLDTSSSDGQPVLGLSKSTYNAIVYYEKGPFTARIAYNWRSRNASGFTTTSAPVGTAIAGVTARTGTLRPNWFEADDQVDASISVKASNALTFYASVTNLFWKDSGRRNYNEVYNAVNSYEISDRQIRIGVRGRF
ncbi:MAG: TonB-dependent receptor [Sphingomonas sp.]|uniref:TonB-dependent receptor n=1 Tax=Sphingomonas sp. TaxID=28214 RepID=UPI0025CFFD3D|nr:TonB-dependent receptor [Sphingomonas sp.]MBX9881536.1 TonB-dependent receptor [Sphingomonas sp.]